MHTLCAWTKFITNADNCRVDKSGASSEQTQTLSSSGDFLALLSALSIGLVLVAGLRNIEFFNMCIRSTLNIHDTMFWKVLRAPTSFFDKSPVGIILTRFTNDLCTLDQNLPSTLLEVLTVRKKLQAKHAYCNMTFFRYVLDLSLPWP